MTTYAYEGLDRSGRRQKGLAEAASTKEAREKLLATGVFVETLAMVGSSRALNAELRAAMYRELSSLLTAGLALDRALAMLTRSAELSHAQGVLGAVNDTVREGAALSVALAKASPSVTKFEETLIQAAERTGTLDKMLGHLAAYLEEQDKIKARVESAIVYPAIVLIAGVCVAILMLTLLLPRAAGLLQESGAGLPLLTRAMLMAGRAVMWGGIPLLVLGWLAIRRLKRRWQQDAKFSEMWDRRRFDWPIVGGLYGMLVTVRFARTLAILLQGGVSLIEAVQLAGRATGSPWIAARCAEQSESIRHGTGLGEAVAALGPLNASLSGLLQVGEAGGNIRELMEKSAERFQDKWERQLQRNLSLLEPLLIVLIGVFVLVIVLSILLPILSMTSTLGG